MSNPVWSPTRRRMRPAAQDGYRGAHPKEIEDAREYLGSRMLAPGLSQDQHSDFVDDELASFDLAQRTWLEMEMRDRVEELHSFDYDAGPYGRN